MMQEKRPQDFQTTDYNEYGGINNFKPILN